MGCVLEFILKSVYDEDWDDLMCGVNTSTFIGVRLNNCFYGINLKTFVGINCSNPPQFRAGKFSPKGLEGFGLVLDGKERKEGVFKNDRDMIRGSINYGSDYDSF